MRIPKRKRRNTVLDKKTKKLIGLLFAFILSSFFIKESVTKEYADPVIGTISGTVNKVNDGDTITILNSDNKLIKIRLYGIDSPELDQEHGKNAKLFLSHYTSGQYITVDVLDIDRFDRSVGRVYLNDIDINRIMVEEGHAWVYQKYCKIPEKKEWLALEKAAKADKKGLWAKKDPISPWDWRQRSKRKRG